MTITINIHGEDAGHALRELRDLAKGLTGPVVVGIDHAKPGSDTTVEATVKVNDAGEPEIVDVRTVDKPEAADDADKRPVGTASGGRARRTKAEIAADEALTKLAVQAGVDIEKLNSVIGNVGREKAILGLYDKLDQVHFVSAKPADDAPQISSGENRVGPEDDPETEAQDAADEAAEVEAGRDPEKPLTADDLKAAMGLYVNKFGLAETQEDGPKVFIDALGAPPAGEQWWKVTLVAAQGQEALKKAIAAWKAAAKAEKRYVAKGA